LDEDAGHHIGEIAAEAFGQRTSHRTVEDEREQQHEHHRLNGREHEQPWLTCEVLQVALGDDPAIVERGDWSRPLDPRRRRLLEQRSHAAAPSSVVAAV
jgi:hypothetical protein